MALINIDPAPLYDVEFSEEMESWLSTMVDELNSNFESQVAARSSDIGGLGAGPLDIDVVGMTEESIVTASIVSSSNPVEIQAVTPAAGKFTITFSADPGASCFINYIGRLY